MAMDGVLQCLARFETHNLDVRWINNLFENDFSDSTELPVEIEDLNWNVLVNEACEASREFVVAIRVAGKLNESSFASMPPLESSSCEAESQTNISETSRREEDSTFWTLLLEQGVNVKGIVIVLCTLLNVGLKTSARVEERDLGITTACLYLNLISIPGSNAFRVFQTTVFRKALDNLKQHNQLMDVIQNERKPNNGKSKPSKQRRGKKQTDNNSEPGTQDDDENNDDGEVRETQEEIPVLNAEDCSFLLKRLLDFCKDLKFFLNHFSLKCCSASLDLTLERLCGIVKNSPALDAKSVSEFDLCSRCLDILMTMCGAKHGSVFDLSTAIFKHLFDAILDSSGRVLVNFLCRLLDRLPIEDISPAVIILIKRLCLMAPERADYRTKVCSITIVFLSRLPIVDYVDVVKWLTILLRSAKTGQRIMALELLMLILGRPDMQACNALSPQQLRILSKSYLLETIFIACSDKASTVRAKALTIISQCITDGEPTIQFSISAMLNPDSTFIASNAVHHQHKEDQNKDKTQIEIDKETEEEDIEVELNNRNKLNWQAMTLLLKKRIIDTNVYVRKAAVQVLQNALLLSESFVSEQLVKLLKSRCVDAAVSVRKQALQGYSSLLIKYTHLDFIYPHWIEGVLSAVLDYESSVQEKCVTVVEEVIFNNVMPYQGSSGKVNVAWKLLKLIIKSDNGDGSIGRCLQKVVSLLANEGRLKANLIAAIKTHVDTENSESAWMLLSAVVPYMKNLKVDFVWDYWKQNNCILIEKGVPAVWILKILSMTFSKVQKNQVLECAQELSYFLENGKCAMLIIPVVVDTIAAMTYKNQEGNNRQTFDGLCDSILKSCGTYLGSHLLDKSCEYEEKDSSLSARYLLTLGEIGQCCPKIVPKRMILLLKSSLVINNKMASIEKDSDFGSQDFPSTQTQDQFNRLEIMKRIPQFAYLTLGKLCLCFDDLAKKCIAALSHELSASKSVSVRRTIVLIMADLCVRFGTLADTYLPEVIRCLRDANVVVRCETVIMLTSLLQEDYLRWRGSLYFALICTLSDKNPQIQRLIRYSLEHVLSKRHPKIFSMHFIECVFFFNNYQIKRGKEQNQSKTQKDAKLFSLSGYPKKRKYLYKFMLEHMSDDEKILVSSRLCKDILMEVVEGRIALRKRNGEMVRESEEVVRDALNVLRSDEIRFTNLKNQDEGGEEAGETANNGGGGGTRSAEIAAVRKVVMTQYVKKITVETIVPIVIDCKRKLEEQKSSLLRDVMLYLRDIMKSYKNELKEYLNEDRRLAAEIEFDLKQLEEMEKNQEVSEEDCSDDEEEHVPPVVRNSVRNEPIIILSRSRLISGSLTANAPEAQIVQNNNLPNNINEAESSETVSEKSKTLRGGGGDETITGVEKVSLLASNKNRSRRERIGSKGTKRKYIDETSNDEKNNNSESEGSGIEKERTESEISGTKGNRSRTRTENTRTRSKRKSGSQTTSDSEVVDDVRREAMMKKSPTIDNQSTGGNDRDETNGPIENPFSTPIIMRRRSKRSNSSLNALNDSSTSSSVENEVESVQKRQKINYPTVIIEPLGETLKAHQNISVRSSDAMKLMNETRSTDTPKTRKQVSRGLFSESSEKASAATLTPRHRKRKATAAVVSTPLPNHNNANTMFNISRILSPIQEKSSIDESLRVDDEKSHYLVNSEQETRHQDSCTKTQNSSSPKLRTSNRKKTHR